jgi:hypothetical protein
MGPPLYNKLIDAALTSTDSSARQIDKLLEELQCKREHIQLLDDEYCRYVSHLIRKHRSSRAQLLLTSLLAAYEAFLWIDYKAKPLSRQHREPQGASFGKKGMSLFGLAAMFSVPANWSGPLLEDVEREGDMIIAHIRVCCDDSDQSVWHSLQVLTTALLLLRSTYPWLNYGPIYTDGAVNFKSLLFPLMFPDIYEKTGFRITNQLLPEAGDGKDRCDRDFAGCNLLFDSWVKPIGRVMMTADDICAALEAVKQPGVINCALQTQRDKVSEKVWKDKNDTGIFAQMAGKKKEDTVFLELVWSNKGEDWVFIGVRLFAYHQMGKGKFLSKADLDKIHPGPRPPISKYEPHITAGTGLAAVKTAGCKKDVKIERPRGEKKRKREARADKAAKVEATRQEAADAKSAAKIARRTSMHCPHCDQGFLQHFRHANHIRGCQQQRKMAANEEMAQREANIINFFQHAILQGHEHQLPAGSDVMVHVKQVQG